MIKNVKSLFIVLACCLLLPLTVSAQQINTVDVSQNVDIEVFETKNFETGEIIEEVIDKNGNVLSSTVIESDYSLKSTQTSTEESKGIPATGANGEILIPDLSDETISSYICYYDNNIYIDENENIIDVSPSERLKSFSNVENSINITSKPLSLDSYYEPMTDNRYMINDTTISPYKRCGLIVAWYDINGNGLWDDNELLTGTGSMQGPDVVLTAAHLVKNQNVWSTRVYYYPAKNGGATPSQYDGAAYSISLTLASNWASTWNNSGTAKYQYDYAVMVTSKDVGQGSWFGKSTTSSSIAGTYISTLGYPEDKTPNYTMWLSSGFISRNDTSYLLEMDYVFANKGHSGGPLYRTDNIVVGILVGGLEDIYGNVYVTYGNKINSHLYNLLQTKLEEGLEKYNY